ncbi:MAG: SMP-30/gluconolactonase/LRE family protein [Rubrivivax sp.]|nr:SMP-30/gluconolactonase/LRE family protein [Rubrivivax sp.]
MTAEVHALPVPPCGLGESPFWHPGEGALYWIDIPGRALHRYAPPAGEYGAEHRRWELPSEPGSIAPLPGGALLIAMRDGLFRFDPASGARELLAKPPYDPAQERFNDGRADPQGRFWVGTIYEPRQPARAALYRWSGGRLDRIAGDVTVSNGLAFGPDGRTMYWADTTAHRVDALDFDGHDGSLSRRRVFAQFETRDQAQAAGRPYGGRPDGAAVDAEGAYWVAMYEGGRLLRLAPDGTLLQELALPVRCPTMPCFGGADLRTLYVTSARDKRPAGELAALPLSGAVLALRVPEPGLPVHFAKG